MNKLFTFARETALGRALIPIGIILIVFGAITMNFTRNTENYIKTEAVVTRTDLLPADQSGEDNDQKDQFDVYIRYSVQGTEYEEYFGVFSEYREGDEIQISYDPEKPERTARPGSSGIFPLAFIGAGILALAGGIMSLIRAMQKYKRMKKQEEEWTNGR